MPSGKVTGLWHSCVADIEAKQRTPDSGPPALATLKMRKSVLEQLIGVLRDLPGARRT